ncbi:MAG TPA: ABC transporter ATP-binding protein [Thermodesulfobacteriota bacterium]|nr:ABC transporter ATP-binding protein [Thermodesulfobacteriota bacterium]
MLEVERIDTFYEEYQALKDISLKVEEGELAILLGPNGHGKSTLLKSVCGLLTPQAGHIRFNGEIINGLGTHEIVKRGLVYIAEDKHLFPEMTVEENLKIGAYNVTARRKKDEHFAYVYGLFPRLLERRKRLASTLSGGEARMLALGRGLMSSPSFLAIDEPSFGLSPMLRTEVFRIISEINKNHITILLVEQSVAETLETGGTLSFDRIYLIENGQIIFEGSKEDLVRNDHIKAVFLGTTD